MKIYVTTTGMLLAIVLGLIGCASQPKQTQAQIMSQYPDVNRLDAALQDARNEGAELLAPQGYSNASELLERALSQARNNNGEAARQTATQGLEVMDAVNEDVATSRDILGEVLQKREDALAAGATTLRPDEMSRLDEDLKQTAVLVEDGNSERAKQRRPRLLSGYSEVELAALKEGMVELAKAAVSEARQQGADEYAPRTLAQAEQEMTLAVSILDADRADTEKAGRHAKNARWLAEKSAAITETVRDFERRDYTNEDIVLWHQRQLQAINQPLEGELPFNESNETVVSSLRGSVKDAVETRNNARNQLQTAEQKRESMAAAHQRQLQALRSEYESRLALGERERDTMSERERAEQQKFAKVQSLFADGEATVSRIKNNVIISAHGFDFPSGQSEIQTGNFPLMNKIIQAVKIFPDATVEVMGHTDATGDEQTNQALSQSRAEKVSRFLTEVGEVSESKVKARGFGEQKPVASNDTPEGRAKNRRVEIAIVNEE